MNKVTLIGRLTNDPELQTIAGDISLTKFGLAVNRRFKKEGQQEADFFNVLVWNKQAEHCKKYINKGSLISLAGRIEIQKWQNNDGENRYTTNIVADEVYFLSNNSNNSNNDNSSTKETSQNASRSKTNKKNDDDLPF